LQRLIIAAAEAAQSNGYQTRRDPFDERL
jgi:hypothetical protein